jgi:biopolymer transport protein ExbB/biopolymer transport protein TolQ
MQWPARSVVAILFLMSAWSIGVMIDRWIAYRAARKQSLQFAPMIAGALRQGNLDEAIRVSERSKKSHLAKVVTSGLLEFRGLGAAAEIPEDHIAASKRALERAEAIVYAEMERGLSGLATIGSTAPFVGCWAQSSASWTPSTTFRRPKSALSAPSPEVFLRRWPPRLSGSLSLFLPS